MRCTVQGSSHLSVIFDSGVKSESTYPNLKQPHRIVSFHTSISWHFYGTSILLTWLLVPGGDLSEHLRLAKYTEYEFTLDDF